MSQFGELAAVNAEVNALPYKADPAGLDDWSPITADGGDCDSYAVAKFRRLHALGWPAEKLRLAVCYTETFAVEDIMVGQTRPATMDERAHCVLIASSDDGDWMLDNRHEKPVSIADLERIGYVPHSMQGSGMGWVPWVA